MGTVMELHSKGPSEHDQALAFIHTYRSARGLPPLESPTSLREAFGDDVKLYRYKAPGRQFAITHSRDARDALVTAGASNQLAFKPNPDSEAWDVSLPSYLWSFI